MKAAKQITIQLVGTRQRRRFTLLDPPFPVVGDLVRLRDAPKTKAGELDWEVIKVEDTQAFIIPRIGDVSRPSPRSSSSKTRQEPE